MADSEETLTELVDELNASERFSFDTETTSTDQMTCRLVGLSFSTEPGKGWYLPVGHSEGKQLPLERVIERLGPIFEDESKAKSAHNANFDITVLENVGIRVRNLNFDTMLAAHVSGRKSIGLKALALELLHEEMTPITDLIGTGRKQITMA